MVFSDVKKSCDSIVYKIVCKYIVFIFFYIYYFFVVIDFENGISTIL